MKTWLISDTHLNHKKMQTYCQRPEDFTERLDRAIHRLVQPGDILIHLGDVGMDKTEDFMPTVKNWPGKKWLVRGNHDQKTCQFYVENGFDMACDGFIYRGCWLTHKPWRHALPPGTNFNLHGHLHNVWDGFTSDDPEKANDEFIRRTAWGISNILATLVLCGIHPITNR